MNVIDCADGTVVSTASDELHSLGYVSQVASSMSSVKINELVAQASFFNGLHDITGVLFYHRKRFFQFLEGPHAEVMKLMDRIESDSRHTVINTLHFGSTHRRRFNGWSMMRVNTFSDGIESLVESILAVFLDETVVDAMSIPDQNRLSAQLDRLSEGPIRDVLEQEAIGRKIIVIGASAGGIVAIKNLLTALPKEIDASILIATHLAPHHKTVLHTILERETGIPVSLAVEGTLLVPGKVHLIPPSKNLGVVGGRIWTSDQQRTLPIDKSDKCEKRELIPRPIDMLFESVAHQYGRKVIGVILSGSGSDGTLGAKSLQEAGAIVLAQTPESAEFPSMPNSVIDAGLVSRVLPPEEIGRFIGITVQTGTNTPDQETSNEDEEFIDRILDLLAEHGTDFRLYKRKTISNRILRRRALTESRTLSDLAELLSTSSAERQELQNDLLICVTSFYRDKPAWEALERIIAKELIDKLAPGEALRVWVPGCATGEEAYTAAILLFEMFESRNEPPNFLIFASDLSPVSLDFAKKSIYQNSLVGGLDRELLQKYFNQVPEGYQVKNYVREKVIFAQHNLTSDPPFTNIHLACCRNVIIYMQPDLQFQVMKILHFSLVRNGLLFLGPSESTGSITNEFRLSERKWNIHVKKNDKKLPLNLNKSNSVRNHKPQPRQMLTVSPRPIEDEATMYRKSIEALCKAQEKTALILSGQRTVELIISDSIGLLEVASGQPGAGIDKLLVSSLVPTVVVNLQQLIKLNQDYVVFKDIECTDNHQETVRIDMEILKLTEESGSEGWLIACTRSQNQIQQLYDDPPDSEVADIAANSNYKQEQTIEIQKKLDETRQVLLETVHELESTQAEQRDALKQLTTANEELQSTNEELQSVNEELYTVNFEYQSKIHELSDLTNDLDNLVQCTDLGVVFISSDMTIRRYSEQAARLMDLDTSAIKSSVSIIADRLDFPELENKLSLVMSLAKAVECDIDYQGHSDRIHVGIYPYKIDSDIAQGAILTMLDLANLKSFSVGTMVDDEITETQESKRVEVLED